MNTLELIAKPIHEFIPKLPEALLVFAVGFLVMQVSLWIIERILSAARIRKALVEVMSSVLLVFFWILLIAGVLKNLGLNQLAITISGSLLVIGLALANGAKTLTDDIISGVYLAKDVDFAIGDTVKVGAIEGTIEKIDIRKVRLRDKNNVLHIVPNSKVEREGWTVLKKNET